MAERAKSLALRNVPWRAGIGWPVVAVEGAALLAIGLFMALRPAEASDLIRTLIALALLLMALQQIANAFGHPSHPFALFQMLRGGVGAAVALVVAPQPLLPAATFAPELARVILGVGLLVVGVVGLAGLLAAGRADGVRLEAVVTSALTIGFGFVLLAGDGGRAPLVGWVVAIAGLGLLLYAATIVVASRRPPPRPPITPA